MVFAAEVVEPAAPELRAHFGRVLLHFRECGEVAADVAAEVHGDERAFRAAARQHIRTRPVRGEQHHFRAAVRQDVFQRGEITLVVAVAAVFVLHLQGYDGTSLCALQVADFLHHAGNVIADVGEVDLVACAQTDVFVREQPRGETAEVPFGADVRTRPQNDVKPELLRSQNKAADVQPARKVKLAFFGSCRFQHI